MLKEIFKHGGIKFKNNNKMSITTGEVRRAKSLILQKKVNFSLRRIKYPTRLDRIKQLTQTYTEHIKANLTSLKINKSVSVKNDQNDQSHKIYGVLAFVNTKSGGGHGKVLAKLLRQIINPENVYELNDENSNFNMCDVLKQRSYENTGYRIIAAGGDGTSAWTFDSLDKTGLLDRNSVAVIPLGTGNDMAGFLNWGYTFDRTQDTKKLVESVMNAEIVKIDRWHLDISHINSLNEQSKNTKVLQYNIFNNYLSIGLDAAVALKFHKNRENTFAQNGPNSKTGGSRIQNIWHYTNEYLKQTFNIERLFADKSLADVVELVCDGVQMNLRMAYLKPDNLLFLNIPSYAGGCKPWGGPNELSRIPYNEKWSKQKADDGILEVIAYTALEFSDILLGGRGHRIFQCKVAELLIKSPIPVKVDGEPIELHPCRIVISCYNQVIGLRKLNNY
ncbi:hypothetical protein GJ496_004327 [Pomphorhynchus laevis]|nr:hypothetical protein GJ496_004327 [Pomphorhynchus laevis]